MTIQEFKKQLKRIGFHEDSTSECKDMLVNLSFVYPINQVKSARLRCAVLFFPDRFHKFFSCHGGSSFPMW